METPDRSERAFVALALVGVLAGGAITLLVGALDAPIVVVGCVALLVLAGMLLRPELPIHLVLFVVYTNASVVAARAGSGAAAVASGVIALLAIPLAYHLVLRRAAPRFDPVFWLMLVLLGIFCISSAQAMDGDVAIQRIISFGTEGVALYFLLTNVVRTLPALRRVIGTLLLSGSVMGGLTLFQAATGTYDQDYFGMAQSAFAFERSDAPAPTPATTEAADQAGIVTRAGGPLNEPNRFAQTLIVLLPLALFQLRFGLTGWSRRLGLGAGLLILGGVLLTYSRGAFLTLAVLIALSAAFGYVRPSRIVLAVVVLLLAVPTVAPGYYDRIGSISGALDVFSGAERTGAAPVARGRTTETLSAFHAFLDHPVLGVGPGQYLPHYSVRYQLDPNISLRYLPEPRRAHNLFAEMAAETGALGLLVFLSMPFVLLRMLWVRRQRLLDVRPDLAFLATTFGLGILGYLGTGVFLHLAFERYYWLLLALAAATCRILDDPPALA